MQPYQSLATRRRSAARPSISSRPSIEALRRQLRRIEQEPAADEDCETDDDEDDLDDEDPACTWVLRPQPSIYDEALIMPIVWVHRRRNSDGQGLLVNLCSIFTVLAVNAVLMILVTCKVGLITQQEATEMEEKLWALCKERSPTMPFQRALDEEMQYPRLAFYFSCSPLAVTLMSRVENLDANNDGVWTKEEARMLGYAWEMAYTKQASLMGVWEHFSRQLLEEKAGGNASALPMAWMLGMQKEIDLCVIAEPALCGNLEARGILERKLPAHGTAAQRIFHCEQLVKHRCPATFGQLHRLNTRWSGELCGEITTNWLEEKRIMVADYNIVLKYVKEDDSIITQYYFVYLVVILLIWMMSMLRELREVVNWWMVLLAFPTTPRWKERWVERDGDSIHICAIPKWHKLATILLNLLPRTLACLFLSYIGSSFLIHSDDYGELILNGVALGFLIEVDNMLFSAVSRDEDKDLVINCQPLKMEALCPSCQHRRNCWRLLPVGAAYTLMLLCTTLSLISYEYDKKRGKLEVAAALRCLCHASGRNCVAAQILGGIESVEVATSADPG